MPVADDREQFESRHLAGHFWSTIEKPASDQADLRTDGELYRR